MALVKGCDLYATNVTPEARKLAEKLGATKVFDSILDIKEDELDVIVDFAGFGNTTAECIEAVRPQ